MLNIVFIKRAWWWLYYKPNHVATLQNTAIYFMSKELLLNGILIVHVIQTVLLWITLVQLIHR